MLQKGQESQKSEYKYFQYFDMNMTILEAFVASLKVFIMKNN